jgi:hypothetical protein
MPRAMEAPRRCHPSACRTASKQEQRKKLAMKCAVPCMNVIVHLASSGFQRKWLHDAAVGAANSNAKPRGEED